jgi:uncharacterized protein
MQQPVQSPRRKLLADEWAYMLPMFSFLGLVWLGGTYQNWYPATYVARVVLVGGLLIYFWPQYTKVRWTGWWLGVIVGVIGIFQWVGMQQFLQEWSVTGEWFKPDAAKAFDPTKHFAGNAALMYTFIAIRWILGASLVVPIMEELFWRDFAWRNVIAPADFKLASVGEPDWKAIVAVSLIFAVVHGNWWLTSIVWAFMIAGLLVYTRSIGACIIAHATTNLLLGAYVLWTRDWTYW